MEGKLIKDKNDYFLDLENKIGQLSLKNCQAIENDYNLDELAEQNWRIGLEEYMPTPATHVTSFKAGFQKALEILGDKKFSEKDVINAFHVGRLYQGREGDTTIENYLQSLQQTEWDVEIITEPFLSVGDNFHDKYQTRPKLDADGCLILKRKV